MTFIVATIDSRDPMLIGRVVKGQREPDYLVNDKALLGKVVLRPVSGDDIYGPFDTIEQAVEWAKTR